MAALPILTRDEQLGIVFVQDERSDGTMVVLKCHAADGGGVAAPSHHPDEEEAWYPLAEQMSLAAEDRGSKDQFHLVLDTSALPAGQLVFDIDRFVERVEKARWQGESVIRLDHDCMEDWGLQNRHPEGA